MHVCSKSLQLYLTFATLWTIACQAPLSMGFSRQEYWSGLPCPPPGDLHNPGIRLCLSLALTGRFFTTSATWDGEGNGNPLQCSRLENPVDRGAWWAAVYAVAQSWTRLKRLSSSSSSHLRSLEVQVLVAVVSDSLGPHGLPGFSVHGILQARTLE